MESSVQPALSSDRYALSRAQAGMWFAQQLDPDNPTFVTGQCIEILGVLAPTVLARAVDLVVAGAPELRTRIDVAGGEVMQIPGGWSVPPTEVVTAASRDAAFAAMRARLRVPMDLTAAPGFGAAVHVLGPGHHALFLRAHHVLLDAYGYSLLGRRIAAVYNALAAGTEPPAPRFDPITKVVDDERRDATTRRSAADRDFWSGELRGAPDAPGLALAAAPPASAVAADLRRRTLVLAADAADRLDAVGRAAGGGWADTVTAALAGYLARATGELDVTLGFPFMNRLGTAAAKVLTTAVNVTPLRLRVDPAAGLAALTETVRAALARTGPHTRYRAEDIHRDLRLPAAAAGPVGPTVNITPFGDTLRFTDAAATVHALARGPVRDLMFVVGRRDDTGELEIGIDADAARYTEADLDRHVAGVTRLLGAAPTVALARVPLSEPEAPHVVPDTWAGAVAGDDGLDVLARFDAWVAARPDAPALVAGAVRLSYRALADRVDGLAAALAARGAGPETLVALALPRTADLVVALLAVLRTGAGYVPLDPRFPAARLEYMLDDSRPAILLTEGELARRVAVPAAVTVGALSGGVVAWADGAVPRAGGGRGGAAAPTNAAYVIYTSGSTGRPKGVVLERRALARFVDAATELTHIDADSRLLAVTTVSFDIAALELFVPLCAGGVVVLADEDTARDPAALAALLAAEAVTVVQATPSLWGALLDHPAADLSAVAVLVGGEALPAPVATGLATRARSVTNLYGPTEATVWCTCAPVPAARGWTGSIGRPFPGTAVRVLDRFLRPVGIGVVGELYVAGPQLARGYRGRPDLTAARFVADPAGSGRLYRTGDLVRWTAAGDLEYLGRGDDQVKIRGHRIELGEIETAAAAVDTVAAAVVVARPDATGTTHLVGYLTAEDGARIDTAVVARRLAAVLPDHLVPTAWVVLDAFPLTPNLKVDRKALPAPDFGGVDTGRGARTRTERALSAMFADLLGLDAPGVDADFFTLGGTSLSATRLLARIAGGLGATVSLRDVFEHPTVAGLAGLVGDAAPAAAPVSAAPRAETMPLSAAQQRLWFLHTADGPSATYNVPFALTLRGVLDEDAMRSALAAVVARHEVLRSVVVEVDGVGRARILPPDTAVPVRTTDVAAEDLDAALLAAARVPFDLTAEIPLRVHLLRVGPTDSVLLLVLHHLAGDEWSARPLLADLAAAYSGATAPDAPGRLQYADYAVRQRDTPTSETSLDFWRGALAGAPEELALPHDRPRPPVPSHRGDEVWLRADADLLAGLRALTTRTGTTMFMLAQAAVAVLCGRLGGGEDLVLGAPVAGRGAAGVEELVGLFVDTLALRIDLAGDPTLTEILDRVRRTDLDAFAHQDCQFEEVVAAVGGTRSLSRHPLFQILVQHRTPHRPPSLRGLEVEAAYVGTGTAKFDLTVEFVELDGDGIDVRLEYALDLFDRGTVQALARRLHAVLEAFAARPDAALHEVDVLLPAERAALAVPADPAPTVLLPALLDAADRRFADRVALRADGVDHRYADLAARVNRLARELISRGIGPDRVVAVAAGRTAATVVALRAVLAAGAAYLPVDPGYPRTRITDMLTDAAPALVLVDALGAGAVGDTGATVLTLADLERAAADRPAGALVDAERTAPVRAANLAYLVYTSGSTGIPKGVPGTVAALTNRLCWQRDLPARQGRDVRLAKSSLSFIDGSTELLAGLLSGALLVLADDAAARDAAALAALIAEHRVTQVTAVPSLAAVLAEHGARVDSWFLSGEPLQPRVIEAVGAEGVTVRNSYGSSEVAGDVTVWTATGTGPVLIGTAVPGVHGRILDARLRPVPDGVVGELYVGGVQLARGYLGRPALTAARFVADPAGGGRRLFRTGDLVRRTASGALAFVSRADNQLSLHGFRIEPGEVEAALATHPAVRRALVTVRSAAAGTEQLVGYVVGPVEPEALRTHLRDRLPDYMIPTAFVALEDFPALPNGKVDLGALPAPARAARRRDPATAAEQHLCAAMAELLGLPSVGPDEDFFALGGNSLLATRLASAVRSRLRREVSVREVFDLRTPARLAAEALAADTRAPLVARDHDTLSPLSAAQGRLWFLSRLEGPGATYNLPFTMRLRGRVDVDALRGALIHLLTLHEGLRTVFVAGDDGLGRQRVLPAADLAAPLTVVDVDGADLDARLAAEVGHVFDLGTDLPVRATLLRTGDGDAHLLLLVHHIAADEWSARPLIADLAAGYSHLVGADVALPTPPPVRYRDFSAWQPEVLGDPSDPASVSATQLAHWESVLAGAPEELTLPRDRPRPTVSSHRGAAVAFEVPPTVLAALDEVAAAAGVTRFMLTHAAVAVLLRALGGGDDVVVGSPVAGRADAALERVVGFFVNTLVLRTDLGGDPTFAQLLARVRAVDLDAYAHQDVPFEQLVERMAPARSLARQPLFQVLVQYRDAIDPIAMAGLDAAPVFPETGTAKFDLTVELAAAEGGAVRGRIEYATDLFDHATAQSFADRLTLLLGQVAADPEARLSALDPLTVADRAVLAAAESGPTVAVGDATLPDRFTRQAGASPGALAVIDDDGGGRWTYAELDAAVDALAARLSAARGRVVAVSVRRGVALVVSLLAIHRAGAAYLPLDDGHPAGRLTDMLADAGPALLLRGPGAVHLDCAAPVLEIDADGRAVGAPAPTAPAEPRAAVHPDSAAYLLYTSGSTGRPKGVLVSHRAIANRLAWMQDEYRLTAADRVLQKTPAGFDVSVWEFFWPLTTGATLVLARPDGHRDPRYLREVLARHRVSTVHFVPSMLAAFLDDLAAAGGPRPTLARVLCSGEALTAEHAGRFHALVDAPLHNLYGPTEAAVDVTAARITPGGGATVPIGRPVWNTRVLVLDDRLRRVPPGVVGELYLGGVQLARGYHDRRALTAGRFVADPYGPAGERLYRTGDLVRWTRDGDGGPVLAYLGRADGQVKLRGQRVELGEIESVLLADAAVGQAAVVARSGRLHAYLVPAAGATVAVPALLAAASTVLPEHMIPTAVVVLDALPLTANGKLDRAALPEPAAPEPADRRAPDGPAETALCALFARALRLDEVGADDDFFALGGDSIVSIQVVNAAARAGIVLGPREIFQWRTPAALARVAVFETAPEAGAGPASGPASESGPRDPGDTGPLPLTALVHRAREAGAPPAGLGAVLTTTTPPGVGPDGVRTALDALIGTHDALRLRLTRVASVLWTLETTGGGGAVRLHDETAGAAPRSDADLVAELDPEAGRVLAAAWSGGTDGAGTLRVAVHPLAADRRSLAVLREDLGCLLRGGTVPRPGATAHGLAHRIDTLAQDLALTVELTHWSQVLAPGGALRVGTPAPQVPAGRRAVVTAAADLAAADLDREPLALAALAAGVAAWRAAGGDLTVEVRRDAPPSDPSGPAGARTVGPFEVAVPVRVADAAVGTARAALAQVPSPSGYGMLRYLNAQTAPVFAALGRPEVSLRVVRAGAPEQVVVDPRSLDVVVVFGEGGATVRVEHDTALVAEGDAHAIAGAVASALGDLSREALSTVG